MAASVANWIIFNLLIAGLIDHAILKVVANDTFRQVETHAWIVLFISLCLRCMVIYLKLRYKLSCIFCSINRENLWYD